MSAAITTALKKGKAYFSNPTSGSPSSSSYPDEISKAPHPTALFPKVNPLVDGEDCEHDCASCEVRLPRGWKIDEDDALYGHVNGWATHLLVATGKADWVKDVADEKGSVMEAVGRWKKVRKEGGGEPDNGTLMLSASNIPLPTARHDSNLPAHDLPTTVVLLPALTVIDGVTPASVPALIEQYIAPAPTTTTLIRSPAEGNPPPLPPLSPRSELITPKFTTHPSPHSALILLCSQRTRDARCGQSAPLLRRELERHLRPLGLYRDANDSRPGGVGIYFISHVGGHKYSANMMIYRRGGPADAAADAAADGSGESGDGSEGTPLGHGEVSQCIWLARVRPEDCEGIVRYTVCRGKIVKPERQLRGGFDRDKGVVSW